MLLQYLITDVDLKKEEGYRKYIKIKLKLFPSDASNLIRNSKELLIKTSTKEIIQDSNKNFPESIFIVGMPRSGSTLVESILSMNKNVYDLGEINICEEAFFEWNKYKYNLSFEKLYFQLNTTYYFYNQLYHRFCPD